MKPGPLCIFAMVSLIASQSAVAGFVLVNPPEAKSEVVSQPQSAPQPIISPSPAFTSGLMPAAPFIPPPLMPVMAPVSAPVITPPVLKGFGRDIPLAVALKQIVPSAVFLKYGLGVDTSIPVTWQGGKPWREVLAETLRQNSMSFSENENEVIIARGANAPTAMPPYAMMPPTTMPDIPVSRPPAATNFQLPPIMSMASSVVTPAPAPGAAKLPVETVWAAKAGDSLRDIFDVWCKKANVMLRWDSEYDYKIESNIALSGNFEAAVRTLLRGLKNATPHPVAQYYKGRAGVPGVLLVPTTGAQTPFQRYERANPAVASNDIPLSMTATPDLAKTKAPKMLEPTPEKPQNTVDWGREDEDS